MTVVDVRELAGQVLLAEYGELKAEQRARIGARDNMVYAALIAFAAVASATVAKGVACLLLLPPVAVLIGWTYLVNDEKVSAAGRYLRVGLGPALAELAGRRVFGWEYQASDPGRARRKRFQLGADLLAFVGLPVAALAVFWCCGPRAVSLLAVSGVELAVLALLAVEIARYAELAAPHDAAGRGGGAR